ncbi:cupin domain-containing protein [Gottschalkiaceae bacterium SANA]|nr:cupin domain-containing protein [Gottschalkiaceae bacterium SANA]
MDCINELVNRLELLPHPEGGYYKQTYKDDGLVEGYRGIDLTSPHASSTAIYFLMTEGNFSALHRLKQDEVWHFYEGSALSVHTIKPDGTHQEIRLGRDFQAGEVYQAVVKRGDIFGSCVDSGYALVGCTVAPGFEFEDFELLPKADLLAAYPMYRKLIEKLTRE